MARRDEATPLKIVVPQSVLRLESVQKFHHAEGESFLYLFFLLGRLELLRNRAHTTCPGPRAAAVRPRPRIAPKPSAGVTARGREGEIEAPSSMGSSKSSSSS